MTPEDWKTYWRTVALTPFQILAIEIQGIRATDSPDWQTARIDAACDFWELQLLGIRG